MAGDDAVPIDESISSALQTIPEAVVALSRKPNYFAIESTLAVFFNRDGQANEGDPDDEASKARYVVRNSPPRIGRNRGLPAAQRAR